MIPELTVRGVITRETDSAKIIPDEIRQAGRHIGELCLDDIIQVRPDDSAEVKERLGLLQDPEIKGSLVAAFTGLLEKVRVGRKNLAEILGVDPTRIAYLQQEGVLPKNEEGKVSEFSLLDIISAIIAEQLVDSGAKVADAAEIVSPLQGLQGR